MVNVMAEKYTESRPRVLPNIGTCEAKSMGIDQFVKCLAEHPQDCRFVMPFGYGFFCLHPDREKIIQNSKAS
jgi:hypothetical protein